MTGNPGPGLLGVLLLLGGLGGCGGASAAGPAPAGPAPAGGEPGVASPSDPKPLEYPRWQTLEPGEYLGYNERASLLQRGKLVYDKYCVGCHGPRGDGKGPAAARLQTKPRDFTKGIFKFRSTDSSSLPLETDLHRTITRGLSRVSMPGFPLMPETDKAAVIQYVKGFVRGWDREQGNRVVVPVPRAPRDLASETRIRRGRVVYITMQCGTCHGWDGAGTGAGSTVFQDVWGNQQRAFNFTRGGLKSGDAPEDVYRIFHTGLISVMPEFGGTTLAAVTRDAFERQRDKIDAAEAAALEPVLTAFPATGAEVYGAMDPAALRELAERNSWDLVAFVMSLRQEPTTEQAVLGARP